MNTSGSRWKMASEKIPTRSKIIIYTNFRNLKLKKIIYLNNLDFA